MGSVVPYPWDTSYPLVVQYLADMAAASATDDIGFSSLEGYISAMFAGQVLGLLPTTSNQTGDDFVDAVYTRELFSFQGIRLGSFGNDACTKNTYPHLPYSSAYVLLFQPIFFFFFKPGVQVQPRFAPSMDD